MASVPVYAVNSLSSSFWRGRGDCEGGCKYLEGGVTRFNQPKGNWRQEWCRCARRKSTSWENTRPRLSSEEAAGLVRRDAGKQVVMLMREIERRTKIDRQRNPQTEKHTNMLMHIFPMAYLAETRLFAFYFRSNNPKQ